MAEKSDITRYITVPPTPNGIPLDTTFVKWVAHILDEAKLFKESHPRIRAQGRMFAALEGLEPGDVGELRDEDWQLFNSLITNKDQAPDCGWTPKLFAFNAQGIPVRAITFPERWILSYIDAWSAAATTKPEPKPAEPAQLEAAPAAQA